MCPELLTGAGAENQRAILLSALPDQGFALTVLTLSGEGPLFHDLRAKGVDTHCAGMHTRTDLSGLKRALSFSHVVPDLIVSQCLNAEVIGEMLAVRSGARHLAIEHTSPGLPLRNHQRGLLRLVAPRIDCVVAVAGAQVPSLVRLGYRRERIRVIPNGVPKLEPTRSRSATRSGLTLREDDFVALLVANPRPIKRADLFLSSVVAANRSNPRVRGLIAGAGSESSRISDLAARSNGVVQLLGPREDVPDLLNAADVLCLTSLSESMPMAILEAMSLGRPVISTDVGGVRELVSAGETGLLLPAHDGGAKFTTALLEFAADPVHAAILGRAGRARYEQFFTADRMIDGYARAFRELCRLPVRRANAGTVAALP